MARTRKKGWIGTAKRDDQVERVPKSLLAVVARIQARCKLRSRYQALELLSEQLTRREDGIERRRAGAK